MEERMHPSADENEENKKSGRFQSSFYDWGEAVIVALVGVILVFTFLVRLIGVDGTSMLPTLQHQDVMLVSNLGYTPKHGDIVVLNKESFERGPIVKRVIATAGDEVDIDFARGQVFVNDEMLTEPYLNDFELPMHQEDMVFPQIVPEGNIFVMGDNRNGSTDSRNATLGMVDTRYVLGHVLAVVWPPQNFGGKTA